MFAFALYDRKNQTFIAGRDHVGIIPLYLGYDGLGQLFLASELKALDGHCYVIESFAPGHYIKTGLKRPEKWYQRDWADYDNVSSNKNVE